MSGSSRKWIPKIVCKQSKHMLKIAHKNDYNAMQKRCEGASSNVAGASIRIMMSHFVALYMCVCVCVCVCVFSCHTEPSSTILCIMIHTQ